MYISYAYFIILFLCGQVLKEIENNISDKPIAVLDAETSAGYFDDVATATAKNQGLTRFLVTGAKVRDDGSIEQGHNPDGSLSMRTYLTRTADFRYIDESPPDRAVMSISNAISQSSVARGRFSDIDGKFLGVGTAHMTLGGFTQDDGFVVSKEFADAEKNHIRGKNGALRPLKIGDKICDHAGNKGVISLVVDRNADTSSGWYARKEMPQNPTNAEKAAVYRENITRKQMAEIVGVFKNNPTLDIVGAPYTSVSRFNGGTAREMIESQAKAAKIGAATTLKIGKREISGGIGYANFIITDMPVDEKTHMYGTAEDGGGRNMSSQFITALNAAGADKIVADVFSRNDSALIKTRELSIVMGCDITPTGNLRVGYAPHPNENRNVTDVTADYDKAKKYTGAKLSAPMVAKTFAETAAGRDAGGFMKLPFEIELASDEKTDTLPVLSAEYRAGREVLDSSQVLHDYTRFYKDIYACALEYAAAKEKLDKSDEAKEAYRADYGKRARGNFTNYDANWDKNIAKTAASIKELENKAQGKYDALASEISERFFTGKHTIFKTNLMKKELDNSATAVISADPMLNINEVRITKEMADSLRLDVGNSNAQNLTMWRDPILSDGGVRAVRPLIVETREGYSGYEHDCPYNDLVGLQMNPASAKSFEGDFDGDSVGLYNPLPISQKDGKFSAGKAAWLREDLENLSYKNNLLDMETVSSDGKHNLYFNLELDLARAQYNSPKIKEKFEQIRDDLNATLAENDVAVANKIRNKSGHILANNIREAYAGGIDHDVIRYDNVENHINSIKPMIEAGAKGSYAKLADYCKYFGAETELIRDDDDKVTDVIFVRDAGHSLAGKSEREASFNATHAKSVMTGLAGKSLQKASLQGKNADENGVSHAKAAMALTHPVTQRVLQLKHDSAEEVARVTVLIQDTNNALWRGGKIEEATDENGNLTFKTVTDDDGKMVYATPDEWAEQVDEFYTAKHGLNVARPNPKFVMEMAAAMSVVDENGKEYIQGYDDFKYRDLRNGRCPNSHPLDDMAHFGNFEKYLAYCKENADLFEGSANEILRPKIVSDNIAAQQAEKVAAPELKASENIQAKETVAKGFSAKDVKKVFDFSEYPCSALSDDEKSDIMLDIAVSFALDNSDNFKTKLVHLNENSESDYEFYKYLHALNSVDPNAADIKTWKEIQLEIGEMYENLIDEARKKAPPIVAAAANSASVAAQTSSVDYSSRFS